MQRFLRYTTGLGVTQGHCGTDTDRSTTYDFLLTFHSNHWPISHRFLGKRRFQSKIAKISTACILRPH